MEEFLESITAKADDQSSLGLGSRLKAGVTVSALLSEAALFAFALLLGSYSPFDGASPFGAAAVFAAWYTGLDPYPACLGAAIGHFIGKSPAFGTACVVLGVLIWAANTFLKPKRVYRLPLGFAAAAVLNALFALIFGQNAVIAAASATVSVLGAVVIGQGLRALRSMLLGRSLKDGELVTLSALAGLISLSLGRISILGQSPAVIFSCAAAMLSACRVGPGAVGTAAALGAGHALAAGADMHFIAVMAAVTSAAASVRALGKWAVLAAFALFSCFITAFVGGNGVIGYWECAAACVIFALIPKRFLKDAAADGAPRDPGLARLQYRVAALSEVLSELSRVEGGEEGALLSNVAASLKRSLNKNSGAPKKRFTVEYGTASRSKHPGSPSGDSLKICESEGRLLIALSDGMGSGEAAKKESAAAVAMLSDLIKVGFSLEGAANCVNSSLAKKGVGDMYATLDALIIDLSDGSCEFTKHGAPPSAVIRGEKAGLISSEALPMGVIRGARGSTRSAELLDGDVLVIMSDGAADALSGGLTETVTRLSQGGADPAAAAEAILNAAVDNGSGDDVTVIVARLDSLYPY